MSGPAGILRVGVAFGSNLGDRLQNLRRGRELLLEVPGVSGLAFSAPLFETAPVDCAPETAAFLNSVVEIGLAEGAAPEDLLRELRRIESALGRPARYPRHAPRSLDLDVLYAGSLVRQTAELTLPHPRLAGRGFVLAPLAALRPALVLPGQRRTVRELLDALDPGGAVREIAADW